MCRVSGAFWIELHTWAQTSSEYAMKVRMRAGSSIYADYLPISSRLVVLFGSKYLFYREAGTKAVLCLTIDDPSAIAL
jgi:hypothetical protein